ncbi:MAG: hypothetical protein EXR74_00655 [Bdellovibrionales bacterium]|nr:hypothetical protein [Bdellovibrionales bacterium]
MKNRLQYLYSITVFTGALVTAYLMMSNDLNARIAYRGVQAPQLRKEASIDPSLTSLFEVEKGLDDMSANSKEKKRVPSQLLFK